MEYCRFHPIKPATYHCPRCEETLCDHCVDEGEQNIDKRCFSCGSELISLGARYNAEPFWRRLKESFHYPLNTETIILVVIMSVLGSVIFYLPFAIIWYLMITGAFMKYCFTCLESTSTGSFKAPDITAAYEGGIVLALQLIAIVVVLVGSVIATAIWLSPGLASFLGLVIIIALPAIMINFSLTENILDAINPLKIIYLITAVGLPYCILLALIIIMMGSVGVLNELFSTESYSFISNTIQSAIGNYYTIVIFHIMGYMIFQYQNQLGFIARTEDDDTTKARSEVERIIAKISIEVKKGNYEKASSLFQQGIKKFPNDKLINQHCFDFLLAIKNHTLIEDFSSLYFKHLKLIKREDQLSIAYKRILHASPNYMPDNPADRLLLAQACKDSGDSRSAVKLLNALHKTYPDFLQLPKAYQLMAEALKDLPKMEEKSAQYEKLATHFEKVQQQRTTQKQKDKKTNKPLEGLSLVEKGPIKNDNKPSSDNSIDYDGGIDFS
jgi:tetratricopeptide (TPR) repeat protein